jgi:hypothetical protein
MRRLLSDFSATNPNSADPHVLSFNKDVNRRQNRRAFLPVFVSSGTEAEPLRRRNLAHLALQAEMSMATV